MKIFENLVLGFPFTRIIWDSCLGVRGFMRSAYKSVIAFNDGKNEIAALNVRDAKLFAIAVAEANI